MVFYPETGAAAESPEILALRSEIEALKAQIRDACLTLGMAYYDAHKDDDEESMDAGVRAIRDATNTILAKQDLIRAHKGLMLCPDCRAEIPANSVFCNFCGARIREPEPDPVPQQESSSVLQSPVCASCGQPLSEGQQFCSFCGTPAVSVPVSAAAPQTRFCTTCGMQLPVHARFCFGCGTPQP